MSRNDTARDSLKAPLHFAISFVTCVATVESGTYQSHCKRELHVVFCATSRDKAPKKGVKLFTDRDNCCEIS